MLTLACVAVDAADYARVGEACTSNEDCFDTYEYCKVAVSVETAAD